MYGRSDASIIFHFHINGLINKILKAKQIQKSENSS
jgi:hypothetical protein